jgi:DNA (cytosine-5)-methyltransferase 1
MLKMIDLFAGIGGIRIAFENNGVKCVASSEIDNNACKTYEMNFGEKPLGDITKIGSNQLPDFDIITAGFPCQPFSLAGLRKGFEDTRGTLFFEVARLIKERKPNAFLLENVEGIVNHNGGKTLEVIEGVLKELGYNFDWKVMNASDFGVPQNRKRWYCVGFKKELNIKFENQDINAKYIYKFPQKKDLNYKVKDIIEKNVDKEYDVSDICKANINKYYEAFANSKRNKEGEVILANEIRPSRCNFRADGISPCLTAKMGTGGNNVPVYVKEMRKLTEKECLRLMGFPKWYKIDKNKSYSYKQIGNSVVVSVVDELAKEMVRVLKEVNKCQEKQEIIGTETKMKLN